jgi:hypothetical protein
MSIVMIDDVPIVLGQIYLRILKKFTICSIP